MRPADTRTERAARSALFCTTWGPRALELNVHQICVILRQMRPATTRTEHLRYSAPDEARDHANCTCRQICVILRQMRPANYTCRHICVVLRQMRPATTRTMRPATTRTEPSGLRYSAPDVTRDHANCTCRQICVILRQMRPATTRTIRAVTSGPRTELTCRQTALFCQMSPRTELRASICVVLRQMRPATTRTVRAVRSALFCARP
ncbi:hypothetical protein J6590_032079 [Homalodisca vitripennis]|nr:hypothetical protein J6590_032079 [Homalodisca vitripennis]